MAVWSRSLCRSRLRRGLHARRRGGLTARGARRVRATLIDRKTSRANGAIALRWTGERFALSVARPPDYERPWARNLAGSTPPATAAQPAARDATPRPDDLKPGD